MSNFNFISEVNQLQLGLAIGLVERMFSAVAAPRSGIPKKRLDVLLMIVKRNRRLPGVCQVACVVRCVREIWTLTHQKM